MVQQSDVHWLRTDTLTEAVRSLEHAADLLEAGRTDAYQLKWALHALQLGVQNFILCTFDFTDRQTLDTTWSEHWEAGFEKRGPYPDDEPKTRYRDVYMQFKKRNPDFGPIAQEYGVTLKEARAMRNGFEHMPPKGWAIEATMLRIQAAALLRVIRYIISERSIGYPAPSWETDAERDEALATLARAEAAVES